MRKFKISRILISSFLALIFIFSTACTPSNSQGGAGDGADEQEIQKVNYDGTHIYTATDTNDFILKNGKTDYILVIPSNSTETIKTALEEFVWLFKKATGVTLTSRKDGDTLQHDSTSKYISLGETSLFKSSGIQIDKSALGVDGLRIVSKDSNIYLVGGSDRGTLYAVYTFMQMNFHFEQYYKDCYEIDTGVTNVKFKKYDVTDIPDIPLRIRNYGIFRDTSLDFDENQFASRLRVNLDREDVLLPIYRKEAPTLSDYSDIFHNCQDYLWGLEEIKPNWFSTTANRERQLCYTARGDSEELQEMAEYCAKKIQTSLMLHTPDKYPLMNAVTLTCEDNLADCQCEACLDLLEIYGTYAGAALLFVNMVDDIVQEWMARGENAAYRRENFKILIFAYANYSLPPAEWDETRNKWVPINNLTLNENVGIWLAPHALFEFQMDVYHELNKGGRDALDAWCSLTDTVYYWMYATNFRHYMYLYNTFTYYNSDGMQFIASKKCQLLFIQAQGYQTGTATAWENLKAYLNAKLMWNTSLNEQELTNNWFNAMFKEAAPIMREMFNDVCTWKVKIDIEYLPYALKSDYQSINNRDYWPIPVLNKWMNMCDDALDAVSRYQTTDMDTYQAIAGHIEAEWLSPAFIMIELWKSTLTDEARANLISEFKSAVLHSGIYQYSEHGSLFSDYIKTL